MLRHWLNGPRDHNHTRTKLTVPKQKYFKGYGKYVWFWLPALLCIDYSSYGLSQEIFPNLPFMKRDVQQPLYSEKFC